MKIYEKIKVLALQCEGKYRLKEDDKKYPFKLSVLCEFPFPIVLFQDSFYFSHRDALILYLANPIEDIKKSFPFFYCKVIEGKHKCYRFDYPFERQVIKDIFTNGYIINVYFKGDCKLVTDNGFDLDKIYDQYLKTDKKYKPVEIIREALEEVS